MILAVNRPGQLQVVVHRPSGAAFRVMGCCRAASAVVVTIVMIGAGPGQRGEGLEAQIERQVEMVLFMGFCRLSRVVLPVKGEAVVQFMPVGRSEAKPGTEIEILPLRRCAPDGQTGVAAA